MRAQLHIYALALLSTSSITALCSVIRLRDVDVADSAFDKRDKDLLNAYLPAQIGGIVGAYALSLVIVAVTLLSLSKRRREHLESGEELNFAQHHFNNDNPLPTSIKLQDSTVPFAVRSPTHTNFSYPQSPTGASLAYTAPTISTSRAPGVDPSVDQEVVSADREMAQSQLEEMYKYVMEQEAAKENGVAPEDLPPLPMSPLSNSSRHNVAVGQYGDDGRHRKDKSFGSTSSLLRSKKSKGLTLNLVGGADADSNESGSPKERTQSRTSSILSALKSPRKKKAMQGVHISSPIMTPMSGTFPRGSTALAGESGEEMNTIPPRHYAPAPPPPVPVLTQLPAQGPTPDISPMSTVSIDQRIGASIASSRQPANGHQRNPSTLTTGTAAPTERDPDSAISADSSAPLVGLPTSPKPGVTRFPSLPTSPRASTFGGKSAPGSATTATPTSAVRVGGGLPLRAYEPAITSPSYASFASSYQTKQTVFERTGGPLSPGAHTPWTGAPVPYSPYQPFSPVVPMTPSLVTKADRKRMRRLEPKTPTMEMVKSIDEVW